MRTNWLVILLVILLVSVLYFIEMSKVSNEAVNNMPTLDDLQIDEVSKHWEPFYKVRATIIDGQSAVLSIPRKIKENDGKELKLLGAPVFFGNGCKIMDSKRTEVNGFFLLPSLGLAHACVLQPDISMRWTMLVRLARPWVINRDDMFNNEVYVSGTLRIDTSKPYDAAFYLENACASIK